MLNVVSEVIGVSISLPPPPHSFQYFLIAVDVTARFISIFMHIPSVEG